MSSTLIVLTITLPWLGGFLVWIAGNRRPQLQHTLAVVFSLLSAVASVGLLTVASDEASISIYMGPAFGHLTFIPDGLGIFLAMIATCIGSLCVIFSMDYMRGKDELGRYYALVLMFIGAMAGLVLTGSFLALFIFWEMTAFCSYALISFHNDDPKAVAGGIKALIITQVGGIGLLCGALVISSHLQSLQMDEFLSRAAEVPGPSLALVGMLFLIAAVAKSAQVPLHTWLPDAMEAPTPVSALIHAATMVNAGVYLLIRFSPVLSAVPGWMTWVMVLGLLSALAGGFLACFSNDLKRVLAYSTISQLGFMVYAVGVGALFAGEFHLLSHSIFKALLFLCAGAVIQLVGTRDMRQMGGLWRMTPIVSGTYVVGLLALVGIPLFNGFFSKEMIMESGLEHGPGWAYAGMMLAIALTAVYATRTALMVLPGEKPLPEPQGKARLATFVPLLVLAAAVMTSWLLVEPFSALMQVTLPFHDISIYTVSEMVLELAGSPSTWLALGVVGFGALIGWSYPRWTGIAGEGRRLGRMVDTNLGFESINRMVVRAWRSLSTLTKRTQTGYLQWNILGIVGILFLLLGLMTLGV
jgi:NADH-quinone oxidoreductase subunit L